MLEEIEDPQAGQVVARDFGFMLRTQGGDIADVLDPKLRRIGRVGLLPAELIKRWDLKNRPAFLELELDTLLAYESGAVQAKPLPHFPAIARDIAVVVGKHVSWAEIVSKAVSLPHEWRSAPTFVSDYSGKQLDKRQKSVAFRVEYRAPDHTLTDEDVKATHDEFVRKLCAALGAEIRK
jgi:phenylalanyl-tRNA synthetase beta chain